MHIGKVQYKDILIRQIVDNSIYEQLSAVHCYVACWAPIETINYPLELNFRRRLQHGHMQFWA